MLTVVMLNVVMLGWLQNEKKPLNSNRFGGLTLTAVTFNPKPVF